MPREPFLHEHREFSALLQIVSGQRSILPELIEKDYWIMHCLWGLQQQEFQFALKGGTSLSKGFGIIHRFSEDIDIRIEPPPGMKVMVGKHHDRPAHIESRKKFFEWLATTIAIPGIVSVKRDNSVDNQKLRSAGIRLQYDRQAARETNLKEGVLLEPGFADTAPNRGVTISSWALDHAHQQGVLVADNRAIDVKCYLPKYTFVEKLQTISTKFRRQQESGSMPQDFLRHYYDVYELLGDSEVQRFIGTEEYEARKTRHFPGQDNRKIAENEAFLLSDDATRGLYAEQYAQSASLYYQGQPPFADILARITENIERL